MNAQKQNQMNGAASHDLRPAGNVLQRKCACGNHTMAGGQCTECGKTQQTLQRATRNSGSEARDSASVPSIVHEVLRSPGQPLDSATRNFFEPRFGQDFSRVRVHNDTAASESAEAVDAHAYTIDRHISFGAGMYAPATSEGRQLLAHELTHVLQQTASASTPASGAHAEREADQNSLRFDSGHMGHPVAAQSWTMQRQEKDKKKEKIEPEIKVERTGTEPEKKGAPVKDKFSFEAEVTVPLTDKLSFGHLSFLDELKLTGEGGVLGTPLGVSSTEYEDLKLKTAMTLAKFELANVKNKSEELRKGKLSFGSTLNTSGGPTLAFDPYDLAGTLGLSLTAKLGATTPSLVPSSLGKLTLGTSLSAGGSLTQTYGDKAKFTKKAESKLGVSADYESKQSRHSALTLGGLLGDKAKFTLGVGGNIAGSLTEDQSGPLTQDKASGKLSGNIDLGLAGTRKNAGTYVKLQILGNIALDQKTGSATTNTKSVFVGITTGVKF